MEIYKVDIFTGRNVALIMTTLYVKMKSFYIVKIIIEN